MILLNCQKDLLYSLRFKVDIFGLGGLSEGEVQLAKGNYYLIKGEENGKERKKHVNVRKGK